MRLVATLRARASLVALATIGMIGFGAFALTRLPSGIYPEIDFPRVVVVARVRDQPPETVQATVTRPLEEALAPVPGLRRLRSKTVRGAVEISAQFEPGTDMYRALAQCETAVAQVRGELPEAQILVERVTPTAMPIITFNVSGNADPRELRDYAALVLRPGLTRVDGVGLVEVQGGDEREFEILIRPADLAAQHMTPSMLAEQLKRADVIAAAGRVYDEHQVLTVQIAADAASIEEILALPIGQSAGGPVPLSTVADVVEGREDPSLAVTGKAGTAVVITVSRAPGASAPVVAAGARRAIAEMARGLPEGVHVETVYDQSELIDDAMKSVRDAILLGVALSLVVLAIFLRDVRAGIAAAIAVPITLVSTFAVMRLTGQTLNLMSLGGLAVAIGLVVDDAIVIVEAIVRRVEDGLAPREAAERGTADLFAAVVGTTFTTVVVFAPLALIAGVVGSFLGALAVTLCASVLLSLVVSVTVVPLVASAWLRPRTLAGGEHHVGRMARGYGRTVHALVRHAWLGVVLVVAIGIVGVMSWDKIATGFLPTMDEGAFVMDFALPQGTSLEETDAVMRRVDRVLAAQPEVVTFTRRTGAEMGPATATQQNTGDVMVRLVARGRRGSLESVTDHIRERVEAEIPEVRIEFVQVLQDVLDDLSGNPNPIEVRIFGDDPRTLDEIATTAGEKLADLPMLLDLFDGVEGEVPVLQGRVDQVTAGRLGIDAQQIVDDLGVAVAGEIIGEVRRPDRVIAIRARFPDDVRFDATRLENVPMAYGPSSVPLATVWKTSRPSGPAVLLRENQRPVVLMTAAVRGGDLGGAARAVKARLADLKLPPGYRLEVGGQVDSARDTQLELAGVFALGSALVLAILLIQLRSLRLALLVLLGAPLSLVGGLTTLAIFAIPLNASSLMGCVLLAGLVVKNGILLLEHAQAHTDGAGFAEALAAAGERRLRPILMTTAATIAGLLPLALGVGAGAELQRPLAAATIGGLVISTLVTLFVLPSLAALVYGSAGSAAAGSDTVKRAPPSGESATDSTPP